MSGYFFLIENDLFCIAKITQLGQAPTSQARPRDTDLSPSNLAGTTLSFVEHTLTKFGGDPCPCEASNCGSGEVLYANRTLFPPLLNSTREARQSLVRVSIPQRDNLFCVLFFGTIWPHFRSEKKSCRNGSGSHVPGKTSRHKPPTAVTLGWQRRLLA